MEEYISGLYCFLKGKSQKPVNYCRGVRASHLFYVPGEGDSSDGRTGNWIIESFKDSKYSMVLPSKDSKKYPFGRFKWEVGGYFSKPRQSYKPVGIFRQWCKHLLESPWHFDVLDNVLLPPGNLHL